MKYSMKYIIWIFFGILLVGNIYFFILGIKLGTDINKYETETQIFRDKNIELEKKAYAVESLQYAASKAAEMNFTVKSSPVYPDNFVYAFKDSTSN